jgi:hypothetical protein
MGATQLTMLGSTALAGFDPDSNHGLFDPGPCPIRLTGPETRPFSISRLTSTTWTPVGPIVAVSATRLSRPWLHPPHRRGHLALSPSYSQRNRERKVDDGKDEMDPRDDKYCRIFVGYVTWIRRVVSRVVSQPSVQRSIQNQFSTKRRAKFQKTKVD